MKLLFCGDIVGRAGRDAVLKHLPLVRREFGVDAAVVSGDNASGGFGITPATARDLLLGGADIVTGGDHVWDQKEIIPFLEQERRLLRPANLPDGAPGAGFALVDVAGKKLLVVHLLGQVFHKEHADCPFRTADRILETYRMGSNVSAIFVDMHAEATSEKNAIGHHLAGRVSAVIGSHTHVPTADARILKAGTAYMTDAGMCGDYNSIIGFAPEGPMRRFLTKIPKSKMEPAAGEGTFCAVLVETEDASGKALSITPIRRGGVALC